MYPAAAANVQLAKATVVNRWADVTCARWNQLKLWQAELSSSIPPSFCQAGDQSERGIHKRHQYWTIAEKFVALMTSQALATSSMTLC